MDHRYVFSMENGVVRYYLLDGVARGEEADVVNVVNVVNARRRRVLESTKTLPTLPTRDADGRLNV